MNICFFAKTEDRYRQKIRYIVDLFFSTYGLNYQPLQSPDHLFEAKSPQPDLVLVYGSWEDYQDLKERISPGCGLLFVSQLFPQVFEPKSPEIKRLKRKGTDFSLPILYAYPSPMQKSLYLVEEKSGREYPGITVEESKEQMRVMCYADLFASSFYLLTLQEEESGYEKKMKERFLAKGSLREKEDAVHLPIINHYFKILFELLQMVAKEREVPLISKKFWPSGSNLAVALTHDVDILDKWILYVLFRSWVLLKRGDFKALIRMFLKSPGFLFKGNKSLRGIDLILEKEKRKDFNSTFFFLAGKPNLKTILRSDITYSVRKAKPAVEKILNSQGEVGLHGSLNSHLKKGDLREEKKNLDKFLPSPCVGIRQHFLCLKVPQTWRFQSESGFLYDCTLGYPDRSGFRSGFALPFQPYDAQADQEIGIWEINTNVMDQTYDKYDPKGKEQIKREIEKLKDQLESANGGLLTLLWHTNVLEEFGFPGFLNLYGELLEGFARRKVFVSTAENITRFWKARKEVKLLDSKVENNGWQWRYQTTSPITDLTFYLNLPPKGKLRLSIDGAQALIKTKPGEALITFPRLDRKQSFQISLISEESSK
ncbi:MAG: polysaccharide deacetylase family protein [candidate division Zixibacteria bacterium]|nr:polysaccharide deacetylase family protein [candidate division Zixibacteria bacterium]